MACTACLPGNTKCHRSLLVELTLTWVNLAPVESRTRVIHHSGHSSNCNWHIKKNLFWLYNWCPARSQSVPPLGLRCDHLTSFFRTDTDFGETEIKLWRKQVCGVSLKGTFAENMGGEEMEDEKVGLGKKTKLEFLKNLMCCTAFMFYPLYHSLSFRLSNLRKPPLCSQ